jgi:tetratricopeptide (TPR) repeat protein
MPPTHARFRVCFAATFAAMALIGAFATPRAHAQKGASCGGDPLVQKLAAQGSDVQFSYRVRKDAYEQALKLCPGESTLYHSIAVLTLQNQDFSSDLRWVQSGLRLWPDSPQLQLDEALALLSGGHPEQALPIFSQLPSSVESQFYLGMAERALGDHQAAQQALSRALDLGSPDPYVLYVLIEQDRDLHDKAAGLRDFQTLAQRFPDSAWLHVVLGDAYMSRYEDSSAQSEYTQALAIDPHLPVIHFQLGYLAFSHDTQQLAAEEFRREIAVDPAFGRAYLYLGLTLRRDGKNQEALPVLERALALEPNSPLPYRALTVVQVNLNQMEAAAQTLRAAKQRFPSEPAFAAQLALLLTQMGRPAEAEEEAAQAELLSRRGNRPHPTPGAVASGGESSVHLPPAAGVTDSTAPPDSPAAQKPVHSAGTESESPHAYAIVFNNLQRCLEREVAACAHAALAAIHDPQVLQSTDYLELKAQTLALERRQPEALAAIQAAVQQDPSQPHYLITQGRIYLAFGDRLNAIPSFLNAAKLEPDSPEPLYFLGTSFFLLAQTTRSPDEYHRAIEHFQLALQAAPDYHRAEFMLGVIDAVQSRLDGARKHLQRAIQLSPSNPYYHLHYRILLKHEGDNRGALSEMKTAEQLNPGYALTRFELGTVYEKLGEYGTAETEFDASLKLNPDLSAPYYHLGAVYAHLGREADSKSAFARFNVMKKQKDKLNSDPAASVISEEDRDSTP